MSGQRTLNFKEQKLHRHKRIQLTQWKQKTISPALAIKSPLFIATKSKNKSNIRGKLVALDNFLKHVFKNIVRYSSITRALAKFRKYFSV